MFYNLRYYGAAVLAVFVLLILGFGFYANQYVQKHVIKEMTARYSSAHFQYFQEAIWERYFPIINFVAKDNKRDPSIIPSYMIFEKEMDEVFVKPEVFAAEFFNNGNLLYSSRADKTPVDETDVIDATSYNQVGGEVVRKGLDNNQKKYLYRSIYTPALDELPDAYKQFTDNLQSQLIVYYDVDTIIKRFNRAVYLLSLFFIVSAVGVFAYAYFYSSKLEKVLEKSGISIASSHSGEKSDFKYQLNTEFFSKFNHELRTPLNAIIGFSELIKNESMGTIDNAKYKEFAGNIYKSGNHLLALVDDVQDFAQAGAGKLPMQVQEVDFTKIIKLCLRMLEPKLTSKAIEVEDQIPKIHYVIVADPHKLKQVILSLLENSIKLNDKNGKISLSYIVKDGAKEGDKITLEIKDTGAGMDPETLEKALEPFGSTESGAEDVSFESEAGEKTSSDIIAEAEKGTGLSLPLTKQLIEMMKGEFDITSELNLGTTVRITFKLVGEEE